MNPYVFIVGCPRSGTTLLKRLVDAHPQVALTHELSWVPRYYERRKGLTAGGIVTPRLIDKLLENPRFTRLQITRNDLEKLLDSGKPITYSSFVTKIFDLYGRARGRPLVGEKNPTYGRHIPTLHSLWPRAKFVHLIRDGRNVCQSVLSWDKASRSSGRFASAWREDRLSTTAYWWKWNVELGRESGSDLSPGLYYELRYEALVADPARELDTLCSFLNLAYDDAMLRFHEGRQRHDPTLSAKHAWLPPMQGIRDWRSEMDAQDVERFEAAAGDLLDDLGYPRAVPRPSRQALADAGELLATFVEDARARRQRLPARWAA